MFNRTLRTLELDYKGYESYLYKSTICEKYESAHYIFKFENGLGASVVKTLGSQGYDQDLWDLCTIRFEPGGEWDLVYNASYAPDNIGWLEDKDVRRILGEIKALKSGAPFSE